MCGVCVILRIRRIEPTRVLIVLKLREVHITSLECNALTTACIHKTQLTWPWSWIVGSGSVRVYKAQALGARAQM